MRLTGSCNIFAHQAKPIVHCPEVVDDCPLILALLPTPGAVGHAIEMA